MTLTVLEQRELRVSITADEQTSTVSHGQAGALIDLADRMGARIVTWQSPTCLRAQQFVGFVRVGDLQLEILPKLDALSDHISIRRSLLGMLSVTQDLEVRPSESAGFSYSGEPFLAVLARLYCRRLLDAVRRGLKQDYVLRQDCLSHVRGKINWPAQAISQAKQTLEFNCIFDERSEDTLLNRTLKAALLSAGRFLEGTPIASVVNELRYAMAGVADVLPTAEQLKRARTDRTNTHLRPLLALAKLILGNCNPDLGRSAQGNPNVYAVVWDMNVLFEEYVGRLTRRVLAEHDFAVDLQEGGSVYLAKEAKSGRDAFLLKPDILVRQGTKTWAVIDTKWKILDPQRGNLGVSEADVYQVVAYAHRYEADLAVLVFPHRGSLGLAGVQKEFLIHGGRGNIRVRVFTLDLASLEGVPGQLERGLVPDWVQAHAGTSLNQTA